MKTYWPCVGVQKKKQYRMRRKYYNGGLRIHIDVVRTADAVARLVDNLESVVRLRRAQPKFDAKDDTRAAAAAARRTRRSTVGRFAAPR